jgi:hypothetical protein
VSQVRRLYVASSWKNPFYDSLIAALIRDGHSVHDWRRSGADGSGFSWSKLDPMWESWTPTQYASFIYCEAAHQAFCSDRDGIIWADTIVLLMPAGASSHAELGFAARLGNKQIFILLPGGLPMGAWKPELMHSFADRICTSEGELRAVLQGTSLSGAEW